MNLRVFPSVVVLVTALLLVQSISVVNAHHNDNEDPDAARDAAKTKSEEFDEKETSKSATRDQKREAFSDYKIAFKAWKTAKSLLKTAKVSGIDSNISGNQTLVDTAKITKDNAWDTYQEVKKKKLR